MEFPFGHHNHHQHRHNPNAREEEERDRQREEFYPPPPPGGGYRDGPPPPNFGGGYRDEPHHPLNFIPHGGGYRDEPPPPPNFGGGYRDEPHHPPNFIPHGGGYRDEPPPPPFQSATHHQHYGGEDYGYNSPQELNRFESNPPVQHVSHEAPHQSHHFPSFGHHGHEGGGGEIPNKPTVRIYTKADTNYSLTIRDGQVVLALSDPRDEAQHWIKDEKYSTRVKDKEGHPSFALVNKATGQAIKHSIGATQPVQLVPYKPNVFEESVLWTESKDLGDSYRCIRMVNDILLNFDAFNGDKNHGGVHDGTITVLWEWKTGDNQRWKIAPY